MKKTLWVLALAVVLLVGSVAPALASSNEAWNSLLNKTVTSIEQLTAPSAELTVAGTSAIAVEPDKASIMLGVTIEDASIATAQENVNTTMQAIVDALKALGIDERKMSTSNYNVYPTYDYSQEPAKMRGYQVSNMLTVEVQEFALISQVIDKAVQAGANQVQSISFDTSKRSELYREALQSAITAARDKASIMAFAAGKQLGDLRSMTEAEQGVSMYLNAYDARQMAGAESKANIMGGELNVTAQVTLVYEMK